MTKKAGIAIQLLVLLIVIVFTSAVILLLVNMNIIKVGGEAEQEYQQPILNTEFIPIGREGTLVVKDFTLCSFIDLQYQCHLEETFFTEEDEVHFMFTVETTPYNGDVVLTENYRVRDPNGNIVLDINQRQDYYFETRSNEQKESIKFKDYFVVAEEVVPGEYSIELVIGNPLITKEATVVKKFIVVDAEGYAFDMGGT